MENVEETWRREKVGGGIGRLKEERMLFVGGISMVWRILVEELGWRREWFSEGGVGDDSGRLQEKEGWRRCACWCR